MESGWAATDPGVFEVFFTPWHPLYKRQLATCSSEEELWTSFKWPPSGRDCQLSDTKFTPGYSQSIMNHCSMHESPKKRCLQYVDTSVHAHCKKWLKLSRVNCSIVSSASSKTTPIRIECKKTACHHRAWLGMRYFQEPAYYLRPASHLSEYQRMYIPMQLNGSKKKSWKQQCLVDLFKKWHASVPRVKEPNLRQVVSPHWPTSKGLCEGSYGLLGEKVPPLREYIASIGSHV